MNFLKLTINMQMPVLAGSPGDNLDKCCKETDAALTVSPTVNETSVKHTEGDKYLRASLE